MAPMLFHSMVLRWLPDLHGVVLCAAAIAAGDTLAIGRPGEGIDGIAVTVIGEDGLAACGIPDLYRAIQAAGGDILAVGRPGDGKDGIVVTAIGQEMLAGGGIPDLHRVVVQA